MVTNVPRISMNIGIEVLVAIGLWVSIVCVSIEAMLSNEASVTRRCQYGFALSIRTRDRHQTTHKGGIDQIKD